MGSEAAALTSALRSWKRALAVSPDGSSLAFSVYPEAFSSDLEEVAGGFRVRPSVRAAIWLLDLKVAGSPLQQVTDATSFNGFPTWSPDGKQLVFTSTRSGSADLYTITVTRR